MTYVIRPDSLINNLTNKAFIRNFEYRLKDTVLLFNKLYRIDSFGYGINRLYFKRIKSVNFYSDKIGYRMIDFQLKDLKGNKFYISDIVDGSKKYTLLDFWGTWCVPCTKLTSRLKRINSEFKNKLDIIGVSYKDSLKEVKKYVSNNHMDWTHAYSKYRKGIIRDLNVVSFPTFILLDNNRKIVYRGTGESALNNIQKILKDN